MQVTIAMQCNHPKVPEDTVTCEYSAYGLKKNQVPRLTLFALRHALVACVH